MIPSREDKLKLFLIASYIIFISMISSSCRVVTALVSLRNIRRNLPIFNRANFYHVFKRTLKGNMTQREEDSLDQELPKISKKFKPFPFSYHQIIDIDIEDITNLGLGVGKFSLSETSKWVIMVPLVLPGERVRVRIFRNHGSYSEADLVEVLQRSSMRVNPPCQYFAQCGGCQYQHMHINAQREWKQYQVETLLEKIAELPAESFKVNPVVSTEHLYGYRSKITPHYDVPRKSDEIKIGFQQRGSRTIIDVESCKIASDNINRKYIESRAFIKKQALIAAPKKGATLLFREADDDYIATDNREVISQTVHDVKFKFKAGEFFQNNPNVLPLMVTHVLDQAHGNGSVTNLVDTYCGSGLFSLCGAKRFETVYGVEVSELAITAAKLNAENNNIVNANFLCGTSDAIFEKIKHLDSKKTVVVIDPPRKGCDESFLNQLFQFLPTRLVYVSCDPATQARDTKAIVAQGYKITNITPFDLFPQTRHIENVMTFEL